MMKRNILGLSWTKLRPAKDSYLQYFGWLAYAESAYYTCSTTVSKKKAFLGLVENIATQPSLAGA